MIDRLLNNFLDFDIEKNHERTLLAGGWIVLFACLVLLTDSGLILYAGALALLGGGFFFTGLYNLIKTEKRR